MNGTFAPNLAYTRLKKSTIENIQFDGFFQAHLDTTPFLLAQNDLERTPTAKPVLKLVSNKHQPQTRNSITIQQFSNKQTRNSTYSISLNETGPAKSFALKAKECSCFYAITKHFYILFISLQSR